MELLFHLEVEAVVIVACNAEVVHVGADDSAGLAQRVQDDPNAGLDHDA